MTQPLPLTRDDALQEFRELMHTYEGLRDMITEDMIPGEDDLVPRMEIELERHRQRLAELKRKYPADFDAPDPSTMLGQTIEDAKHHMLVLEQRKADAVTKWGYFEKTVKRIVECEYQMRNYTPVVFDASGLHREGIVYYDAAKQKVVVTHPLRVAQCTLQQTLLNGPFRKG